MMLRTSLSGRSWLATQWCQLWQTSCQLWQAWTAPVPPRLLSAQFFCALSFPQFMVVKKAYLDTQHEIKPLHLGLWCVAPGCRLRRLPLWSLKSVYFSLLFFPFLLWCVYLVLLCVYLVPSSGCWGVCHAEGGLEGEDSWPLHLHPHLRSTRGLERFRNQVIFQFYIPLCWPFHIRALVITLCWQSCGAQFILWGAWATRSS